MVPKKSIERFQQLYEDLYGIKIDIEEARKNAENLMNIYQTVFGSPILTTNINIHGK